MRARQGGKGGQRQADRSLLVYMKGNAVCSAVFGPLVFLFDLGLLLGCKVVLDVEQLADLFGRLRGERAGGGVRMSMKRSCPRRANVPFP